MRLRGSANNQSRGNHCMWDPLSSLWLVSLHRSESLKIHYSRWERTLELHRALVSSASLVCIRGNHHLRPPVTQKRSSRVTDGETGRRCRRWGRCRGEQKAVGLADLRRGSRWYPGQVSRLANEKTWRRCPACYLCSSRFPTEHQQHEVLVVFLHTFISASIHRPVLGSNFPTWQNTHHGCSVLAFHLSVIWNHNIQHSSWQNNTVTWLTQHIGNAQEWGGIWPPSLQTPSYASVSAAQRKRRAAQPPEGEMTWWQKRYNVAPVKTMPTLKRGVVLCWVGTMFFM